MSFRRGRDASPSPVGNPLSQALRTAAAKPTVRPAAPEVQLGLTVPEGAPKVIQQLPATAQVDLRNLDRLPAATVVTLATPPFVITHVNVAWENLCGFTADEAVGRTCTILQGRLTDPRKLATLRSAVTLGKPCQMELVNYRKDGSAFVNELTIAPLLGPDGGVTHLVGTLVDNADLRRMSLAVSPVPARNSALGPQGPPRAPSARAGSKLVLKPRRREPPLPPPPPLPPELSSTFGSEATASAHSQSSESPPSSPGTPMTSRGEGLSSATPAPGEPGSAAAAATASSGLKSILREPSKRTGGEEDPRFRRPVVFCSHLADMLTYNPRETGLRPMRAFAIVLRFGRREIRHQSLSDVLLAGNKPAAPKYVPRGAGGDSARSSRRSSMSSAKAGHSKRKAQAPRAARIAALAAIATHLPADDLLAFRLVCKAFSVACSPPTATTMHALVASKARIKWARRDLGIDLCTREESCELVAARGDLELLRWLRKKEAPCGVEACVAAARGGYVDVVRWLARKGCASDARACAAAAQAGHLEALQALRASGCPWDVSALVAAATGGHVHVLEWARGHGGPVVDEDVCLAAAAHGHVRALDWLHTAGCGWTEMTVAIAGGEGRLEAVQHLCSQGCPVDATLASEAARGGHGLVLEWAHARGYPLDEDTCMGLASCGALELLQWARAEGVPWTSATATSAAANGHVHVLQWALDNGCEVAPLTVRAAAADLARDTTALRLLAKHPRVPEALRELAAVILRDSPKAPRDERSQSMPFAFSPAGLHGTSPPVHTSSRQSTVGMVMDTAALRRHSSPVPRIVTTPVMSA